MLLVASSQPFHKDNWFLFGFQWSRVHLLVASSQPFCKQVEHWFLFGFQVCYDVLREAQAYRRVTGNHQSEVNSPSILTSVGHVLQVLEYWLSICKMQRPIMMTVRVQFYRVLTSIYRSGVLFNVTS